MFPDIARRTGDHQCAKCKKIFARGDRLQPIYLVAGVGAHDGRERSWIQDEEERGHYDCANPTLIVVRAAPPVSRYALPTEKALEELRPRTPDHSCANCRKRLKRGDRLVMCFLVQGVQIDPQTNAPGTVITPEHEFAHVSCTDPDLSIGEGALILHG